MYRPSLKGHIVPRDHLLTSERLVPPAQRKASNATDGESSILI